MLDLFYVINTIMRRLITCRLAVTKCNVKFLLIYLIINI